MGSRWATSVASSKARKRRGGQNESARRLRAQAAGRPVVLDDDNGMSAVRTIVSCLGLARLRKSSASSRLTGPSSGPGTTVRWRLRERGHGTPLAHDEIGGDKSAALKNKSA
jgi:hypothetical protein